VIWVGLTGVGFLFAGIAIFGLWAIVAAVLPVRIAAASPAAPRNSTAMAGV
jgi:hypothetical protein